MASPASETEALRREARILAGLTPSSQHSPAVAAFAEREVREAYKDEAIAARRHQAEAMEAAAAARRREASMAIRLAAEAEKVRYLESSPRAGSPSGGAGHDHTVSPSPPSHVHTGHGHTEAPAGQATGSGHQMMQAKMREKADAYHAADSDGDGSLDYPEFCSMPGNQGKSDAALRKAWGDTGRAAEDLPAAAHSSEHGAQRPAARAVEGLPVLRGRGDQVGLRRARHLGIPGAREPAPERARVLKRQAQ
jgi:hypothetical protein